jgi:hypothetical protein
LAETRGSQSPRAESPQSVQSKQMRPRNWTREEAETLTQKQEAPRERLAKTLTQKEEAPREAWAPRGEWAPRERPAGADVILVWRD